MTKDGEVGGNAEPEGKPGPPQFVGGKPRSRVVPLDWPLSYRGKTYDRITVRRMTTGEVGEFIAAASSEDMKNARLPMFDCPPEIIDALDPDDAERVNEVIRDFLPRLLRQAGEPRRGGGESTLPSSHTS
ncbi:phage tail assembly protein [Bradyrhizobium sp. HKCCYLRH3095]|uniref:phage tail assembly protein n=1 Tax=Bradyrhizobium sp. HKCCYLRH3095 TaxID=3420765 RepID=UPI003EBDED87